MSKTIIAGNAVIITSDLKLEDIKTIQKYRPSELILMGGEDGKDPVFAVGVASSGAGSINSVGVSFGTATHDDAKKACVTLMLGEVPEGDVKEIVADKLGGALIKLNKLEEKLPAVLAEIEAEKRDVMDSITVQ